MRAAAGDRFYLLAEGEVEVSAAGEELFVLPRATTSARSRLLRDVPRTATVRAREAGRALRARARGLPRSRDGTCAEPARGRDRRRVEAVGAALDQRARARPLAGLAGNGMTDLEPARWWSVRRAQNLKPATYTCPLCDRRLHAMSEHMLLVPEGDSGRRRHAHTDACVPVRARERKAAHASRMDAYDPRPAERLAPPRRTRDTTGRRLRNIIRG